MDDEYQSAMNRHLKASLAADMEMRKLEDITRDCHVCIGELNHEIETLKRKNNE